ncbi:LeuA family protein [Streptomyces sp. NPDC058665]|uniref:LeuA family protein n=1 Tax=Streptomyces sp. NPDC058665 TaxID=3346586 RepID=UPI0036660DB0
MPVTEKSGLRRIGVYDTTLRDGEQAPGNAMAPAQKLEIALSLEALGVDIIEAGFPNSSPSDFEATRMIAEALTTARVATLSRTVSADVLKAVEAAGVENHQVEFVATASELHLDRKRGITRQENLREVVDAIRFTRSLGVEDVSLGLEDASRGSIGLLRELTEAGMEAGATTVVVADTTGYATPEQFGDLIATVREWVPDTHVLSVHCHQDLGLALANALAGVRSGADEVQVTVAGIGERAGNTALEEMAAVLAYKGEQYGATTDIKTERLYEVFELVARTVGLEPSRNKAIVGVNAFAHEAGIHQAGVLREPATYEYVEPARFGRTRSLIVGRHSGRTLIRHLLGELGAAPDEALVDRVYRTHVERRQDDDPIDLEALRSLLAAEIAPAKASV